MLVHWTACGAASLRVNLAKIKASYQWNLVIDAYEKLFKQLTGNNFLHLQLQTMKINFTKPQDCCRLFW